MWGAHRTPCARRARAVRVLGPARVMASAGLSSPRGHTQYPCARLEPWPRSGPPPAVPVRMCKYWTPCGAPCEHSHCECRGHPRRARLGSGLGARGTPTKVKLRIPFWFAPPQPGGVSRVDPPAPQLRPKPKPTAKRLSICAWITHHQAPACLEQGTWGALVSPRNHP